MKATYNRNILAEAIAKAGIKRGDVVFSHSNIGYFGFPEEGRSKEIVFHTILDAFFDVLGDEGTLIVPTFTYSFCKGQPFDPAQTPSTCGIFPEMLRQHPDAHRSHDPIFSVTAIGKRAKEFTSNVPVECFGKDSFWERFLLADGIICNLNFDAGSTFIHYVERCLNVPYRYNKLFTGFLIINNKPIKGSAIYFCRDLSNPDTVASFEEFDKLAREEGLVHSEQVGRGAIVSIRAKDTYDLISQRLNTTPWFLTKGSQKGKSPVLISPFDKRRFNISLSKNASMKQIINALWLLPRDIVSDGYDAALYALAEQIPMIIHEYPTGTECWTWIIPEKWTCHEAYLEDQNGKRLFSYSDNPLHVISYSLPFDGWVTRDELFDHLFVHPKISEAIPFVFKYYERDWGLCCSKKLKDSLRDDKYRVVIKTSFSYSTLKVGEVVIPGKSEETIILCAHLCHPGMVNDDLTGIVVGLEVMRELSKHRNLHYTYRFLIVPETIGSIAYLSHNEDLIPLIKGGLFLEMLGLNNPHALQLSFAGETDIDKNFSLALKNYDTNSWIAPYFTVIGNDERQFNAPGVRIPMLSLSRVLPRTHPDWPYKEYHSSFDNNDLVSFERLEDSKRLVLAMIDVLENNVVPKNKFKGELFCSRYGIHIDWTTDPEGHKVFFQVMALMDGKLSIVEIASKLNVSFNTVKKIVDILVFHDLVECKRK
ncbi:DUF4910 domain-containing protein [Desulfonauticus submarinus]